MRMKRILLIVPSFPQLSETFIVSKFLGLLEKGWDVHIVCSKSNPAQWRHFPALLAGGAGVRGRVHVSWPVEPRWRAALLLPVALLRALVLAPGATLRYLRWGWRRFGPDVLRRFYLDAEIILARPDAVHFEFGALAVGRTYLKDLLGCKLLVSFRGYDISLSGLDDPDFYHEVWDAVDGLSFLSSDLWERAQKRGCPATVRHVLIPPAINVPEQRPDGNHGEEVVGTEERPLRILAVGRTVWVKGYEYALHAVKCLIDEGIVCHYRIIGDGDMFEGIAFTRHQLGLDECVELPGSQPPDEVRRQMGWADLFLQASVQEGFCNAVIEAQAAGLPVVCSNAGGLPENVEDGVTGFVVPRRDSPALAEKLALLASKPELRERMGRAGRERVLANFTLPRQIERFDEFYRLVLESRS